MRKLAVDMGDLIDAMDQSRETGISYLDTQTGKVEWVVSEYYGEEEDEERRERLEGDVRYVLIPEPDTHEAYRVMEDFVYTVRDPRMQKRLAQAIAGKGAFRRFKDALFEDPGLRERWFDFEAERAWEAAEEWLASIEIENTTPPPQRQVTEPPATVIGVQHVQITIPAGREAAAREFYLEFMGLTEAEKPEARAERGGFWMAAGEMMIHVAVQDGVDRRTSRAHVAYQVTGLERWEARLRERGMEVERPPEMPGWKRFQFRDPFGNRVEMMESV
jgi:predicted enzyme related to lactoylglutathione lyase